MKSQTKLKWVDGIFDCFPPNEDTTFAPMLMHRHEAEDQFQNFLVMSKKSMRRDITIDTVPVE